MGVETTLLDPRKADQDESTITVSAPVGIRSLSLTVIAIVAAVVALQYGQQFFIPLVISVLVSYALDPVVSWIARRRVPRALAAAVVLLIVVGSIGGGAYRLRDEAATILQQLPQAAQRLRAAIRKDRQANGGGTIEQMQKAASELSRAASEAAPSTPPPKGVLRVQVEQPAVKVSDYLWWSSAEHSDVHRSGHLGAVPRVLHADVWRHVQAQAGAGHRPDVDEEEDHRADPRRDLRADRALPAGAGVHERAGRHRELGGIPVRRARAGGIWPLRRACSTRFPTSVPSSSPAGSRRGVRAVRHDWHGRVRRGDRTGDHQPRRVPAHAVADEPRPA